ncbi:MAG TPA: leucyl/phenylalanyl-tRNA--protein transferase [Streptosporangiaceae bacterium]|jgi:leucyl/phenylalanyl-tRNA--protein transferase
MPISRVPDWDSFEIAPEAVDCPVAFCADLSPDSVLTAYRRGIVPFPAATEYLRDVNEFRYEDAVESGLIGLVGAPDEDPYWAAWWCPDPRPLIGVDGVHLGRNTRKRLRRGDVWTTADQAYQRVAEQCRDGREPRWLTDTLLESMVELHREGWAHSIEVWEDGDLVGGALAVGVGRMLSGDSMFSRRPDAARIAVADMAARFAEADGLVIDAQWDSPFLRSLGAELLPRDLYLNMLSVPAARAALPAQRLPTQRLPASRLLDPAD